MASVVITRATASKQIPKFIVDVLRNNVSNPTTRTKEFIFKDTPEIEFKPTDFPYVIVSESDLEYETLDFMGSRGKLNDMMLSITVYHNNPKERDEVCDEIRKYLSVNTSEDEDGTSLLTNQIKIKNVKSTTSDLYTDYPKVMRVKEITVTLNYWGV